MELSPAEEGAVSQGFVGIGLVGSLAMWGD